MKFNLSPTPLEDINLKEGLASERAGGFCSFEGIVRCENEGMDVQRLEYEAFFSLCEKEAAIILQEAREQFEIIDARIYHRTGTLDVGEMAVWIGVTSAHRDAAFKACRYLIEELKGRLPIWKKEYYSDGDSGWIHCEHSDEKPAKKVT